MPSCRRYREVLRPIGWLVTENGDANVGSMPAATTSKHIYRACTRVVNGSVCKTVDSSVRIRPCPHIQVNLQYGVPLIERDAYLR